MNEMAGFTGTLWRGLDLTDKGVRRLTGFFSFLTGFSCLCW